MSCERKKAPYSGKLRMRLATQAQGEDNEKDIRGSAKGHSEEVL